MPTGYPLTVENGDKYGRLTIIKEVEKRGRSRCFLCECDCGKLKEININDLRNGRTKSCGCLLSESSRHRKLQHGKCNTRLYSIWNHMKYRCSNASNADYKHYGGRGINICEDWLDFQNFYTWAITNGYQDDLTIERIDNNGNYEPSNCRWASRKEQVNNTRKNINITYDGKTKTLKQWSESLGIKYSTLYRRLSKGCPVEKALTTPVKN